MAVCIYNKGGYYGIVLTNGKFYIAHSGTGGEFLPVLIGVCTHRKQLKIK